MTGRYLKTKLSVLKESLLVIKLSGKELCVLMTAEVEKASKWCSNVILDLNRLFRVFSWKMKMQNCIVIKSDGFRPWVHKIWGQK